MQAKQDGAGRLTGAVAKKIKSHPTLCRMRTGSCPVFVKVGTS
jgi:hypothetical protein